MKKRVGMLMKALYVEGAEPIRLPRLGETRHHPKLTCVWFKVGEIAT